MMPEGERIYTRGEGKEAHTAIVPVDGRGMVLLSAELLDQLLLELGFVHAPEAPVFPPAVQVVTGTIPRLSAPGYPWPGIPG